MMHVEEVQGPATPEATQHNLTLRTQDLLTNDVTGILPIIGSAIFGAG